MDYTTLVRLAVYVNILAALIWAFHIVNSPVMLVVSVGHLIVAAINTYLLYRRQQRIDYGLPRGYIDLH